MRIVNWNDRLAIELDDGLVDVEKASNGEFGPEVQPVYDRWADFTVWAQGQTTPTDPTPPIEELGAVAPAPRQVFAVGLNYRDHAAESKMEIPEVPIVFTKFQSSITGPYGELSLPNDRVDWEVELVVVIGKEAWQVSEDDAWSTVAGLTVGNDYSDRRTQMAGKPWQFSLGKSLPGFSPVGPRLITLDEVDDHTDLAIECKVNDTVMQSSRSSNLIFDVPYLIRHLSHIVTLYPGDTIWTGTPGGVGIGHNPRIYLAPGDVVRTTIEGIGHLEQTCI